MTGLCTDLYEIRMAVSYLRRGMTGPATFSLSARWLPTDRGYLVAAGLADCLHFLDRFQFDDGELHHLGRQVGLDRGDLAALREVRFTGDVRAVPEGRVVFAGEPLLEVTAPIAQAQLIETAPLNLMTFQTAVASKAARCRVAAGTADLVDFAARRTHGLEAAMAVARASAVAGFDGTSYLAAARRYGLAATGRWHTPTCRRSRTRAVGVPGVRGGLPRRRRAARGRRDAEVPLDLVHTAPRRPHPSHGVSPRRTHRLTCTDSSTDLTLDRRVPNRAPTAACSACPALRIGVMERSEDANRC